MAVRDEELKIHYHQVIEASDAIAKIKQLEQKYALNIIVMGNLATAQIWQEKLNRVQIEKWSFETKESGARSQELSVSSSKY